MVQTIPTNEVYQKRVIRESYLPQKEEKKRRRDMSYIIKHSKRFRKFYLNVGGRECFLKYEKIGEGVLDFKVLFVPKDLRNIGIAEKVLKRAIGFSEKNNFKIRSGCSYINNFFDTHSEFKNIISNSPEMITWVLHYN